MTIENFEMARCLLERKYELNKMKKWLVGKNECVRVLGNNCSTSDSILVSDNMREHMIEDCNKEIMDIMKEFESL